MGKDIAETIKRADRFKVILIGEGILVGFFAGFVVLLYRAVSYTHLGFRGRRDRQIYIEADRTAAARGSTAEVRGRAETDAPVSYTHLVLLSS